MRIKSYPSETLNNTEILSHRKTKNGLTGKFYESSGEMAKHTKKSLKILIIIKAHCSHKHRCYTNDKQVVLGRLNSK